MLNDMKLVVGLPLSMTGLNSAVRDPVTRLVSDFTQITYNRIEKVILKFNYISNQAISIGKVTSHHNNNE